MNDYSIPDYPRMTPSPCGERCVLTVREQFAAVAMQAVIAKNPPCGEYHVDMGDCDKPKLYARAAVLYADALIAALESQP